MTGKQIFEFYTASSGNSELYELVPLLPIALSADMPEVYNTLERMNKERKKLTAVYPGLGQKAPTGAEEVGSIPDGVLYLI